MTNQRKRDLIIYGSTLAISLGLLYLCTDNAGIKMVYHASKVCQSTARTVGNWGLRAECLYHAMLEQNRTI